MRFIETITGDIKFENFIYPNYDRCNNTSKTDVAVLAVALNVILIEHLKRLP